MSVTRPSIFISGSAAGIGRATAERFAREGYTVGIYDIDLDGANEAAKQIGEGAVAGHLDVTDPSSWSSALAAFFAAAGDRLDVLVNNAGIMITGSFESIDLQAQFREVDVNVKGTIAGCYAGFPYLKRTPKSRVINLCSASAVYGQPDLATYSATKFFVQGLTEALQIEWHRYGIGAQAIWPLYVNTALVTGAKPVASMATLGVRLTAEDVANVIWETASSKSRKTHRTVGRQTAVLKFATKIVPRSVTRFFVAKLAGK